MILIDSTTTQRLYLTLLLRSDCNWLYYYAVVLIDSTTTQRLYLTLLLRSDCNWLYYYAVILIDSTTTQRLYLTLLLRSDCNWLYYYAVILIDSLLRSDCHWLYYYAAILLDSTTTQRCCSYIGSFSAKLPLTTIMLVWERRKWGVALFLTFLLSIKAFLTLEAERSILDQVSFLSIGSTDWS